MEVKMKNLRAFVLCFFPIVLAGLAAEGCKKDTPPEVKDPKKPGKREYAWTVDTLSYPGSFQTTMRRIWAIAPSNVYVVGHNERGFGKMYHYNGENWQPVRLVTVEGGLIEGPIDLSAIYGFAANDIYAVGQRFGINPNPPPNFLDSSLIIHFDGSRWREVELLERGRELIALQGFGTSTIWAGGLYGTAYHRSGATWSMSVADTVFWFRDFAMEGGETYALAYYVPPGGGGSKSFSLRWQASQWQIEDSTSDHAWGSARFGENALCNIGGTLYSAGRGVFRKDGSQWVRVMDTYPKPIYAIFGTRSDNIFAAGESALIYHFNGTDWAKFEQFMKSGVVCGGIWCTEEEVFVVCEDGNNTYVYHGK